MSSVLRIISGPTGSGKTLWATQMARRYEFELFNADAFQFYREIPVLSNQPKDVQQWHFMAFRSISDPINAGDFGRMTEGSLDRRGLWVGTGLYVGAALYGFDADRRKGVPFQGEPKRKLRSIVFNPDRASLYRQLDERVDVMMSAQAVDEARMILNLLHEGVVQENNPILKAIGLKHLLSQFSSDVSLERAVIEWKRDTRRLAKRQWTWLRKFMPPSSSCLWVDPAGDLAAAEAFLFADSDV